MAFMYYVNTLKSDAGRREYLLNESDIIKDYETEPAEGHYSPKRSLSILKGLCSKDIFWGGIFLFETGKASRGMGQAYQRSRAYAYRQRGCAP